MSGLPWLLGGTAIAFVAYELSRRPPTNVAPDAALREFTLLPGRWVWPVGVWRGRRPQVSDGFAGTRRSSTGARIRHGGLDIMFRRLPGDPWSPGTPNGARGFVMPDHRAALAASDGIASYAAKTPRGWTVIIDHAPHKLATYYTHFSQLLVVPKQQVRAGQPIGIIGGDPLDGAHLMHLHFETWRGGPSTRFDPQPFMTSWDLLPDPGDMPATLVASSTPTTPGTSRPTGS
jgi:murein DD-endopeptidase MepM/ murein hydrolase activator NlpD